MNRIFKPMDFKSNKNAFDIIRGVAVLLVLFAHLDNYSLLYLWPISMQPIQGYIGRLGVDLFFILSGFLIWTSASKVIRTKPNGLKVYFIHRISRIYPLYLFHISFIAIFATFFIGYVIPDVNLISFLRHLFFLQTMHPSVVNDLNGVTWTLTYEFGFYIIVPLIVYCRFDVKCLIFSIIVSQLITIKLIGLGLNSTYLYYFLLFWPLFAVGIIVSQTRKIINPITAVLFLIISFYIFILFIELRSAQFLFAFFLFNLLSNFKYDATIFRPLIYCGMISYSLYLWHKPLILLISPYITNVNFIISPIYPWLPMGFSFGSFLIISLKFLISTLSFFLIEKPSMTHMRNYIIERVCDTNKAN